MMTHRLVEAVTAAYLRAGPFPQVKQPTPDFGGPGVAALQSIAGIVLALCIVVVVIGGIGFGGLMVVGHFSRHGEALSRGIKGIGVVILASALLGSVAALVNWGLALQVVT